MRSSWFLAVAVIAACGPSEGPKNPGDTDTGSGGGSSSAAPTAGGDDVIDVAPSQIKGLVFQPQAMDGFGVPAAGLCKRCTVDTLKAALAKAKNPIEKQAHAVNLASELFRQSQKADGDQKKQLLTDAVQALRDGAAAGGAKPDETLLLLLGRYQLLLDDPAGAEKTFAQLLQIAPNDKEAATNRAWWALSLLKQGKNADALAVVKDASYDKSPELAYVTAWAKWRNGDAAGAWQAITAAANTWDGPPGKGEGLPGREVLKTDLAIFAGRTNTKLADAVAAAGPFFGKQPADQYELVRDLSQSYHFAADWQDTLAADNAALAMKTPANDRVSLLLDAASVAASSGDPKQAGAFAKQSIDALPLCADKCSPADQQNVYLTVFGMAARFHSIYATTQDQTYYFAAHDLYGQVVAKIADTARRETAADYQAKLEATFNHRKPGTGRHDKNEAATVIEFHNQEAQACYEAGLQQDPKLSGDVVLHLEVDQSGAVTGVSTDPKAGAASLPAVAGCIATRAKSWKLPARGSAGTTRISAAFQLALRK